jgi:hypothetical protein
VRPESKESRSAQRRTRFETAACTMARGRSRGSAPEDLPENAEAERVRLDQHRPDALA